MSSRSQSQKRNSRQSGGACRVSRASKNCRSYSTGEDDATCTTTPSGGCVKRGTRKFAGPKMPASEKQLEALRKARLAPRKERVAKAVKPKRPQSEKQLARVAKLKAYAAANGVTYGQAMIALKGQTGGACRVSRASKNCRSYATGEDDESCTTTPSGGCVKRGTRKFAGPKMPASEKQLEALRKARLAPRKERVAKAVKPKRPQSEKQLARVAKLKAYAAANGVTYGQAMIALKGQTGGGCHVGKKNCVSYAGEDDEACTSTPAGKCVRRGTKKFAGPRLPTSALQLAHMKKARDSRVPKAKSDKPKRPQSEKQKARVAMLKAYAAANGITYGQAMKATAKAK